MGPRAGFRSPTADPRPTTWHQGLLARDEDAYAEAVVAFVTGAERAGRPVLLAVPDPTRALLEPLLSSAVSFVDIEAPGRNPARLIPMVQDFVDAHPGVPVSLVGEPVWAGRSGPEVSEVMRHEALVNEVFADADIEVLCAYLQPLLPPGTAADVGHTHPVMRLDGHLTPSESYLDPWVVWSRPPELLPPPPTAARVEVQPGVLPTLRTLVRALTTQAGLDHTRGEDLVVSACELATNSLVHGGGQGVVTAWAEPGVVVCEIHDHGWIEDPLAGRRRPDVNALGGRGLWMVNQLCDLVQMHSTPDGTTVRVRVGH